MALGVSSILVYLVMLIFQIFYLTFTILFPCFTKYTSEFAIQQVNEVYLTVILIFFMKQKIPEDWGVTTNSDTTKNIAITLIYTNTLIVIILILTKPLRKICFKVKQCKKKVLPLNTAGQHSEPQSAVEQEAKQEETSRGSKEHKPQDDYKRKQEDKLEKQCCNFKTQKSLLNLESDDVQNFDSLRKYSKMNANVPRINDFGATLPSWKSSAKYKEDKQ